MNNAVIGSNYTKKMQPLTVKEADIYIPREQVKTAQQIALVALAFFAAVGAGICIGFSLYGGSGGCLAGMVVAGLAAAYVGRDDKKPQEEASSSLVTPAESRSPSSRQDQGSTKSTASSESLGTPRDLGQNNQLGSEKKSPVSEPLFRATPPPINPLDEVEESFSQLPATTAFTAVDQSQSEKGSPGPSALRLLAEGNGSPSQPCLQLILGLCDESKDLHQSSLSGDKKEEQPRSEEKSGGRLEGSFPVPLELDHETPLGPVGDAYLLQWETAFKGGLESIQQQIELEEEIRTQLALLWSLGSKINELD